MFIHRPKHITQLLVCGISFFLLLFSEILYVKTGYGPISIFLLVALPLAIGFFVFFGRFSVNRIFLISYTLIIVQAFYTIAGIFIFSRTSLAIQFLSVSLSSFLFLNIGFYGSRSLLARMLVLVNVIALCFSVSQLLFFSVGVAGPFSLFEKITNITINSQVDFSAEVIYGRSAGIFNNPNTLGFFSGLSFFLIFVFKRDLSEKYFKIGLISAFLCLILSISRGSLIAFFSSGLLLLAFKFKHIANKSLTSVLYVFLGLLVVSVIMQSGIGHLFEAHVERFSEIFNVIGGDFNGSANAIGRIEAWNSISNKVSQMPFGTILPPQLVINESPDNQLIYYFAQGGLLLVVMVTVFYGLLLISAKRYKPKYFGVFLTVIVFVIINSLTMTVMNSFIFMIFWMYLGLHSRPEP